ncbi:MAG TPA: tol-pal system-associated acyl-CoA thioesterase [Rudaea sp.]
MATRGSAVSPLTPHLSRPFSWPIRVYWEDTDAGGVVYHASYLRFLERARTEWLRAQGVDQPRVRDDYGVLFVVRDMEIDFLLPARLDDELDVTVETGERRSASMVFSQRIVRRADGAALVAASVRAACIEAASFKPCRIPNHLFEEKPKA